MDEALYLGGFPECGRFENLALLPVLSRRNHLSMSAMRSTSSGSVIEVSRKCRHRLDDITGAWAPDGRGRPGTRSASFSVKFLATSQPRDEQRSR